MTAPMRAPRLLAAKSLTCALRPGIQICPTSRQAARATSGASGRHHARRGSPSAEQAGRAAIGEGVLELARKRRPDLPAARDPREPDEEADAQPSGHPEGLAVSGGELEQHPATLADRRAGSRPDTGMAPRLEIGPKAARRSERTRS